MNIALRRGESDVPISIFLLAFWFGIIVVRKGTDAYSWERPGCHRIGEFIKILCFFQAFPTLEEYIVYIPDRYSEFRVDDDLKVETYEARYIYSLSKKRSNLRVCLGNSTKIISCIWQSNNKRP